MKLTIKTIFGERTFELPESVATDLIEQAEEACDALLPITEQDGSCKQHKTYADARNDYLSDHISDEVMRGYKGFLYIKCEKCGVTKGYCTSRPLHYHKCGCRHNTPLVDLATVKANCKCGESFTYKTNIVEPYFTMNCMACGNPIELELDGNGTSYVTMK